MPETWTAKDVRVRRVNRGAADDAIRAWHYSHMPYVKSVVHFGVFLGDGLVGALQLGDPLDIHHTEAIFVDPQRDEYIELNRMALSEEAPRCSESRALAVVVRLLRRERPRLQWIISYADATQCGDGTIYRAAGWLLTQVRRNTTLYRTPIGVVSDVGVRTSARLRRVLDCDGSAAGLRAAGERLPGYQVRYIMPMRPGARERLRCEILPYDHITPARMVRGLACAGEASPPTPSGEDVRPDPHARRRQMRLAHTGWLWED